MGKKLWICVLIIFLFDQFGSLFRTGFAHGTDRIPSYASLDLKKFETNYTNEIVGKTFLSFGYLIKETFQISLLVETDDPDRPKVLIQFYPNDAEAKEYKSRGLYKIPLSDLEINKNHIDMVGLDINKKISDFTIISISRVGIRGIDCCIGFIRLTDPNTYDTYLINIDPDPNVHIFDQGWASNNPSESFQVTMTIKDDHSTIPYIYIKGEKVSAPLTSENDSKTDTFDGESGGESQFLYNPYLYPGWLYPIGLSNESDNEYGYYYGQGVNHGGGLGLYAGQYGGYSGNQYRMYGGLYGSLGIYGGMYGGLGMYGGSGLFSGGLYGMYSGLYGSLGIYGGLGMYGMGLYGRGLYGMYGNQLVSLGLYSGLYNGLGGFNGGDILLCMNLLQNPDLVLPLPGDISNFLSKMFGSFSSQTLQ